MEIQINESISPLKNNSRNTNIFSSPFTAYKASPIKTHLSFKKPECGLVLNDKCCIKPKENEYSLTTHFFDPNHHSPPNDFLLKLQSRMNEYYKKESNLFNE